MINLIDLSLDRHKISLVHIMKTQNRTSGFPFEGARPIVGENFVILNDEVYSNYFNVITLKEAERRASESLTAWAGDKITITAPCPDMEW
jgi:hypothetical protein